MTNSKDGYSSASERGVPQTDGEDLSAAGPIAFPGAYLEDSGEQVVARWGSA